VSRIGRLPIAIPQAVNIALKGNTVSVTGPKGKMERQFHPSISIAEEDGQLVVTRGSDQPTERALHGTTRAVLNNMVTGVSTGFVKQLDVDGVGYRAELVGQNLMLYVGYSHPVEVVPPEGISFEVDTKTRQIRVIGHDKELVGQVCANIREVRPPEPYKGKGIRYHGEKIRRKAGKSGKAKK
jgi:large subunit ribosomal protein L6